MKFNMKNRLKSILYPIRKGIGRFAIFETNSLDLFFKAGSFIAADQIEGDYLEFGVFSGQTFASAFSSIKNAYELASTPSIWNSQQDCLQRRYLWEKMRFFAFDSFQGLPKPFDIDTLSKDFKEGKFCFSQDGFKREITAMGVPLNRVEIIPGWFEKTLNEKTIEKYGLKKAAIIHIDSDLYESAKSVLNFITSLLVDGTIIIFDDWYNFRGNPDLGEQRAFNEWLSNHPDWMAIQYQKEGVWKNSFILNKKKLNLQNSSEGVS